jgi:hypothetical protein
VAPARFGICSTSSLSLKASLALLAPDLLEANRIYWLYREEGPGVRKSKGRRRAIGIRAPLLVEVRVNARWSLD